MMAPKNKLIVGLTGGMGAGKSTVASLFKKRGVAVWEADAVVHRLWGKSSPVRGKLLRLWGPRAVRPDGSWDLGAISQQVFHRPSLRHRLESILHPEVSREMRWRIRRHRRGWLVMEIPLLFEAGLEKWVDRTLVVWASQRMCLTRLARDGRFTPSEIRRRWAAQLSVREKCRRADAVIKNSGSLRDLTRNIEALMERWGKGD